jgi:hypothetical protein
MSLTDLANLGEILAAIGVVASLIYVGYQIRETRKAVRAATAQARTDLGVQLITTRYTSDISELLTQSLEQPDSLSPADSFKLKSFFTAHVRHCQNLYYQKEQGLLDEYFSHGVARIVAYWVRNYPWAKAEWNEAQKTVPPRFKNFINAELEKHPGEYQA